MKNKILSLLICVLASLTVFCGYTSANAVGITNEFTITNDLSTVNSIGEKSQNFSMPADDATLDEFIDYGESVLNSYLQIEVEYSSKLIEREVIKGKNKIYFAEDKDSVLLAIEEAKAKIEALILPQEEVDKIHAYKGKSSPISFYLGKVGDVHLIKWGDGQPLASVGVHNYFCLGFFFDNSRGLLWLWDGEKLIDFREYSQSGDFAIDYEIARDAYYAFWGAYDIIYYNSHSHNGLRPGEKPQSSYLGAEQLPQFIMDITPYSTQYYYDGTPLWRDGKSWKSDTPELAITLLNTNPLGEIPKGAEYLEVGYIDKEGKYVTTSRIRLTEELLNRNTGGYVEYGRDKSVVNVYEAGWSWWCPYNVSVPMEIFDEVGSIQFFCRVGDSLQLSNEYYYRIDEVDATFKTDNRRYPNGTLGGITTRLTFSVVK